MTTTTTLPIISGRQQPAPGTKRDNAAKELKKWLLAHNMGGTYYDIGVSMGLTPGRVADAAPDLHLFDKTIVVSIPAPHNGYLCRARWNLTAKKGEANQQRHSATRDERAAVRLRKAAVHTSNPADATLMLSRAVAMEAEAVQKRLLAEHLER